MSSIDNILLSPRRRLHWIQVLARRPHCRCTVSLWQYAATDEFPFENLTSSFHLQETREKKRGRVKEKKHNQNKGNTGRSQRKKWKQSRINQWICNGRRGNADKPTGFSFAGSSAACASFALFSDGGSAASAAKNLLDVIKALCSGRWMESEENLQWSKGDAEAVKNKMTGTEKQTKRARRLTQKPEWNGPRQTRSGKRSELPKEYWIVMRCSTADTGREIQHSCENRQEQKEQRKQKQGETLTVNSIGKLQKLSFLLAVFLLSDPLLVKLLISNLIWVTTKE